MIGLKPKISVSEVIWQSVGSLHTFIAARGKRKRIEAGMYLLHMNTRQNLAKMQQGFTFCSVGFAVAATSFLACNKIGC
jgi:hypothetical protein